MNENLHACLQSVSKYVRNIHSVNPNVAFCSCNYRVFPQIKY